MNIKLKNALIKEITDTLKTAKTFSMDQLPQVAKELVLFGRIVSTFFVTIASILLLVGLCFFISNYVASDFNADHMGAAEGKVLLGVVFSTVGIASFISSIESFICSVFTPKLYILKQLRVIK